MLNINTVTAAGGSADLYSPISVKIIVPKDTYEVGEAVEGQVELSNSFPVTIPAVFTIKLFHEDTEVSALTTSIRQVFPLTIRIPFKSFGIPAFNDTAASEGNWRIVINQQNFDVPHSTEAKIHIAPSTKTP